MIAAILGAAAGGAAGAPVWLIFCEGLECLGWPITSFLGAALGAAVGFTTALDVQRWLMRRRPGDPPG